MYRLVPIFLAIAIATIQAYDNRSQLLNSAFQLLPKQQSTLIVPNSGWHSFLFGRPNVLATPQFTICINNPAILRITDAFCPGDTFSLYSNGVLLMRTSATGNSSDCTNLMIRPEEAFFSSEFSHGEYILEPGAYGVNILGRESPLGVGIGYVRLDLIMPSIVL